MADIIDTITDYLDETASDWDETAVMAAYSAERAAQSRRCRVPDSDEPGDWPADLLEALCRRVAANLANRALPLGLQSSVSEAGVGFARTGGGDREVNRLEAPHRKLVLG